MALRRLSLPLLPLLFAWGSPLSPQCGLPYTTLDDPWRAVSHGGAGPAGGYAGDVQNASSTAAACRPKATGVGGGRWYRFTGAGGDALPLSSVAPPSAVNVSSFICFAVTPTTFSPSSNVMLTRVAMAGA